MVEPSSSSRCYRPEVNPEKGVIEIFLYERGRAKCPHNGSVCIIEVEIVKILVPCANVLDRMPGKLSFNWKTNTEIQCPLSISVFLWLSSVKMKGILYFLVSSRLLFRVVFMYKCRKYSLIEFGFYSNHKYREDNGDICMRLHHAPCTYMQKRWRFTRSLT